MATKVRQRLRSIMDYAAEQGLIPINPIPAARRGPTPSGRDLFGDWMKSLNDRRAVAAILLRIGRIRRGLFGDCKSVGDGVQELRIDVGQGYRV